MNKKTSMLLNIIIIGIVFVGITIYLLFLPRETVSKIENRKLAEMPEFSFEAFFSGKYTSNVSEFFNDTVPNRDFFKQMSANLQNMKGIKLSIGSIYGNMQEITSTEPPAVTEKEEFVQTTIDNKETENFETEEGVTSAPETTTAPEETTINPKNEIADGVYTNGQIVVYQNGHFVGMSMYGGGTGERYAKSLNALKEDLGENINLYSMVIPTASEYYTPINFSNYNASQKDSIDNINSILKGVVAVDAVSALGAHENEPIYTRTDHHWQPLGAYYAAEAFAKTANVPFLDISEYEKVVVPDYVGTLYSFTQSADLLNDPEDFIYYKPPQNYKTHYYTTNYTYQGENSLFVKMPTSQSYSTFMGGDNKIVRVETNVKNGRKLAVVKDSYGNAEIPFYTGSFEEIYVIDMRYFDLNLVDFIKEHEVSDVLFTMCSFSAVGTNSKHIDKIRTQ